MLSRTYTAKALSNGLPFISVHFEEKHLADLASFLNNEVDDFPEPVLASLESVLEGQKPDAYFYGNLMAVEYDKNFAFISHQLEERSMPLVMAIDTFYKLCQEFMQVKADLAKKNFSSPLILADGAWFAGNQEN